MLEVEADSHFAAYEKLLGLSKAQYVGIQWKVMGLKACAALSYAEQSPILQWKCHQLHYEKQALLQPVLEEEHNQQADLPLIDQQQGCLLGAPTGEKQNPFLLELEQGQEPAAAREQ